MIQAPYGRNIIPAHHNRRDRQAAWCARFAIVGVFYFITAVVILHPLRPDLNPVTHAVSNYANGPFGFLMTSAFFVLAISEFALAWGLARCLSLTRRTMISVALLGLTGSGLIVTGLFRSDVNVPRPPASASAIVHWIGAGGSFLSLMIAIFLLSGYFKKDAPWQSFSRLSYSWLAAIVLALAAYGTLSLLSWTGIGERIYIATSVVWLLLASLRLRTVTTS
ncbi:MAG TPA: DUF998 domain-containing protein [Ktedonobacteraceae bacterium]|nr:DUF998 domain-containing protein [Ktedonobacteraceae bacterium]